ncbi:EAL domain-containing protein [Pseudoalteromonas sp. T1lg65]|uniref:bifunctional diguanylate cyclase/phosphodiesterase n=1 Tax=Pseudoalteromonas sp. T1lg65 TaxID=2077101 RepID=UPI003F78F5FB
MDKNIVTSHLTNMKTFLQFVVIALLLLVAVIAVQENIGLPPVTHFVAVHTLLEMLSISVSLLIFSVGWSARAHLQNNSMVLLCCCMLSVALFDALHLVSYPGMPELLFSPSPEKAINFWLAARILSAIALLVIAFEPAISRLKPGAILFLTLGFTCVVIWMVLFQSHGLPSTFIYGFGLTGFTAIVDYLVIFLFICAAALLMLSLKQPKQQISVVGLIAVALVCTMSEFLFTLRQEPSDTYNIVGHVYKVLAYLILYRVILAESITFPYQLLKASQLHLKATLDSMPDAVFELDRQGNLITLFPGVATSFFTNKIIVGNNITQLLPRDDAKTLTRALALADIDGFCKRVHVSLKTNQGLQHFELAIAKQPSNTSTAPLFTVAVRNTSESVFQKRALAHEALLNEGLLHLSQIASLGDEKAFLSHSARYCRYLIPCTCVMIYDVSKHHLKLLSVSGEQPSGIDEKRWQNFILEKLTEGTTQQSLTDNGANLILTPIKDKGEVKLALLLCNKNADFEVYAKESALIWGESLWSWLSKIRQEDLLNTLSLAVDQNPNPILITNTDVKIEYINNAYLTTCGYRREELIGQSPNIISSGHTSKAVYKEMWKSLKEGQSWVGDLINRTKSGKVFIDRTTIFPIKDSDGKVIKYISFKSDVTQQVEDEARIHRLSFFDQITGLPNQAMMHKIFSQLQSSNKLHSGALMLINLDNFKVINDALGHDFGNLILKEVAIRLEKQMVESDFTCRFSGDTYIYFMSNCDMTAPHEKASQLLADIKTPMFLQTQKVVITASMGVALYPTDANELAKLILCAETATYKVKDNGRNNYMFFNSAMLEYVSRHLQIINALNFAIIENELSLVFQPQISITTKDVIGVEVLVRWHSKELGHVSPAEFIPIAESCGIIKDIDEWVFENAVKQAAEWQALVLPEINIAINLSASRFSDEHLIEKLLSVTKQYQLASQCIELELTESVALKDPNHALTTMKALRVAGFKISVDDFGTGYSSMNYLKLFSLDKLKIDKSFIDDLASGETADVAIVQAIVDLAKHLNMVSIAEGVETHAQWELLVELGCDQLQGYVFSKPLSNEELIALLQSQAPQIVNS